MRESAPNRGRRRSHSWGLKRAALLLVAPPAARGTILPVSPAWSGEGEGALAFALSLGLARLRAGPVVAAATAVFGPTLPAR